MHREAIMNYVISVFQSRNETLYFGNMLRQMGIFVSIINTPKEAGQACGISVRFDQRNLLAAKKLLASKPFRSFKGFYKITNSDARMIVEKI